MTQLAKGSLIEHMKGLQAKEEVTLQRSLSKLRVEPKPKCRHVNSDPVVLILPTLDENRAYFLISEKKVGLSK